MPKVGRDTATWRKLRVQCFQRDRRQDAPCWICGGKIDYSVQPSSTDDSWEPDHRFTVKSHPELAEVPDNVLPSHRKCNRSRGDRAGINTLGNRSRLW